MSEKNQKNFHQPENKSGGFPDRLADACAGLFYVSETDAPLVPFVNNGSTELDIETILRQDCQRPEGPVTREEFNAFYDRLTKFRDWFGEREKERAAKFAALQQLLTDNLVDLKIFRIGSIQLDIYIVGMDANGRHLGVKTKAVET